MGRHLPVQGAGRMQNNEAGPRPRNGVHTMLIEVKVPQLPESVSEATLVNWHKKPGESVSRDENLIDLETDKVVLELPAPQAGVLVELVEQDGATVVSGQLIARIDTAAVAGASAPAVAQPVAEVAVAAQSASAVMPAARKLAAETGVDAGSVAGSGRDGRILRKTSSRLPASPRLLPRHRPVRLPCRARWMCRRCWESVRNSAYR